MEYSLDLSKSEYKILYDSLVFFLPSELVSLIYSYIVVPFIIKHSASYLSNQLFTHLQKFKHKCLSGEKDSGIIAAINNGSSNEIFDYVFDKISCITIINDRIFIIDEEGNRVSIFNKSDNSLLKTYKNHDCLNIIINEIEKNINTKLGGIYPLIYFVEISKENIINIKPSAMSINGIIYNRENVINIYEKKNDKLSYICILNNKCEQFIIHDNKIFITRRDDILMFRMIDMKLIKVIYNDHENICFGNNRLLEMALYHDTLIVSNYTGNILFVINLSDYSIIQRCRLGGYYLLTAHNNKLYVTNNKTIKLLDIFDYMQ
jgi:hypothetical protein